MIGQGCTGQVKTVGQLADRKSPWAGLYQQAIDRQSVVLGQRAQSGDCL